MAAVASCLYVLLKQRKGIVALKGLSALILILSVLSGGYFMGDFVQNADQGETSVSSYDTMQGEFLPVGTNREMFADDSLVPGAELEIYDYTKKDGVITVSCKNNSGQENCADVSFLYYRGYQAVDQVSGERLNVTKSGENKVRVMIPAGYEGTFRVQFVSPWYWRAGEVVSFGTLVGIIIVFCLKKKEWKNKLIPRRETR